MSEVNRSDQELHTETFKGEFLSSFLYRQVKYCTLPVLINCTYSYSACLNNA